MWHQKISKSGKSICNLCCSAIAVGETYLRYKKDARHTTCFNSLRTQLDAVTEKFTKEATARSKAAGRYVDPKATAAGPALPVLTPDQVKAAVAAGIFSAEDADLYLARLETVAEKAAGNARKGRRTA